MKFLAILRDSVREAIDSKVFFVMIGLSSLLILLVASISYRPIGVEEEVTRYTDMLTWAISLRSKGGTALRVSMADFQQTNDTSPKEPWRGDYRFTLVFHFPVNVDEADQQPETKKAMAEDIQRTLRRPFYYLNDLRVTSTESPNQKELRFLVTTHGTKVSELRAWPHEPTIFFVLPLRFMRQPLGQLVHFVENILVNFIGGAVALLLSTVITAFFIPNMLRKGTIDFLIVKPIHRTSLLIYKYIGGLSFMFLNTAFIVVGIWLVLGLRSDLWGMGFLVSILVLTYQFALYYSISTLFGVLTRSPIVSILMACLAWFLFSLIVGWGYQIIDATRVFTKPDVAEEFGLDETERPREKPMPDWVYTTADIIHLATPHLKDLDVLTSKLINDDLMPPDSPERKQADKLYASFKWSEALIVTTLYMVVFLALACWWFATKDY